MQYTSELTLVNQGTLFVNGTNNFNAGSATTNWTLTGATAGSNVGNQVFENDGAVDVIGTSGGGTTTANFTGNVSITGSGQINVYGNASVVYRPTASVSAAARPSISSAPTATRTAR